MEVGRYIGIPALLEQRAEECAEFSKACLKLARKIRNENPTPADTNDIIINVNEEASDVLVCIDSLLESRILTTEAVQQSKTYKRTRWEKRISEHISDKKEN